MSAGQLAKRSQRSAPGSARTSAATRALLRPNRSAPVRAKALHVSGQAVAHGRVDNWSRLAEQRRMTYCTFQAGILLAI